MTRQEWVNHYNRVSAAKQRFGYAPSAQRRPVLALTEEQRTQRLAEALRERREQGRPVTGFTEWKALRDEVLGGDAA